MALNLNGTEGMYFKGDPTAAKKPKNPQQAQFENDQLSQTLQNSGMPSTYGMGSVGPMVSGYNVPARGAAAALASAGPDTVQAPGYARGSAGTDASVSQGAFDRQQEIQLQHDLRLQELAQKKDMFERMLASFGGGGNAARITRAPEDQAKEAQARDAAFARAKERAGQTAGGAVQSLRNLYAGQGLTGSTMEAAALGGQVGNANANIGEFLREQAMQEATRAGQIADMTYQGDIAQRGQDAGRKQALISLLSQLAY